MSNLSLVIERPLFRISLK